MDLSEIFPNQEMKIKRYVLPFIIFWSRFYILYIKLFFQYNFKEQHSFKNQLMGQFSAPACHFLSNCPDNDFPGLSFD